MKNIISFSAILFLLVLLVTSCGFKAEAPTPAMAPEMAVEQELVTDEEYAAPSEPGSGGANYAGVERLIVRKASLDIVVPDTKAALDEIKEIVNGLDGYVVESTIYQQLQSTQASATLRVPAEHLDQALERFRKIATEVRRESVSGQDVTEEYVDLRSRLRYLEATEARLLEFLKEAEDTEAALAVYENLQEIQADIEHVKGRIQYLEQSAAMATIEIDITPDELAQPIQVGGWHPEGTLRDAFQSLIRVLQFLVNALIVIVVLIIPVLVVVAAPLVGLLALIRAIVRRRRAHRANGAE